MTPYRKSGYELLLKRYEVDGSLVTLYACFSNMKSCMKYVYSKIPFYSFTVNKIIL